MSAAAPAVIRAFKDADADAVAALWRGCFPDDPPWNEPGRVIASKRAVQPELFFVAVADGVLAGTAMGGYDGHRGWVYAVAVRADCRRRGIGAALMERVESALRGLGCVKINLQVRSGNEPVAAFYRNLGYRTEERISMGKLIGGAGTRG